MTPEIKTRIDQIRRGEVPEGYKKTGYGIIPCDWENRKLAELLEFKNGLNLDKEKYGQGVKLISVRDVLADKPITYDSICGAVNLAEEQLDEYGVTYGDILFQRSSENYEDVGTANVYLDHTNIATFSGFVIRGKRIAEYNPIYLCSLLHTPTTRKEIIRRAAGAQHINIGQDSLAQVSVSMATQSEQQKIADILTTQDKVIELKEKRLAEKRRQKKYLMQQLLTGEKRLPGFGTKWSKVRLHNIARRIVCKNDVQNGNVLTISAQHGLISQTEFFTKRLPAMTKAITSFCTVMILHITKATLTAILTAQSKG